MTQRTSTTFDGSLQQMQRLGAGAAAVGTLAAIAGLLVSAESFFQGYLTAFVFWSGLSLGFLGVLLLHHLVVGAWGYVTQRILEAGALTVGLAAVLFIPLAFGLHPLYEWTHAEVVAESPVLQHKKPYLNVPFFLIRAVLYFVIWGGIAYFLRRWSIRLDETGDPAYAVRLRRLGAGGLVAHILLVTFASTDWIMSLDPHWFSTVFGWLLTVSQGLTALAVTVIVLAAARHTSPLDEQVQVKHFHDYGNLILTFVILWAYMMFVQFLIMWSGNIPEDIRWYVERQENGWGWVAPFLIVFHFVGPFLVLLSRRSKRSGRALAGLAGLLLVVHVLFVAWLVLPSFPNASVHAYWIAAVAFVGMGGAWAAVFAWGLRRQPTFLKNDPRYELPLNPTSSNDS
jgi:hypothetical protein